MSTAEETTTFRDEIMQLVSETVSLSGFRKQAADLDWQVHANSQRKRLRLAHKRLGRKDSGDEATFDAELLNRHEKTPAGAGVGRDFGNEFTTPARISLARSF
jgi:hypothetical protein